MSVAVLQILPLMTAAAVCRKASLAGHSHFDGIGRFPVGSPTLSRDVGNALERMLFNMAVSESDLLIAVGVRFDDGVTGKLATFAPHASVIHVDIDPANIGKNVTPDFKHCS